MDEVEILASEWRRLDDELEVTRWRTERLLRLGYEAREAAHLALTGIDLHALEHLIAKGCSRQTAVRIVA
jgi:hypothetical protein